LSLRESIRRVRLGWKNYYKYAPLVYLDPGIPIPVPKRHLNYYTRSINRGYTRAPMAIKADS
jgi:hypothetical protein